MKVGFVLLELLSSLILDRHSYLTLITLNKKQYWRISGIVIIKEKFKTGQR